MELIRHDTRRIEAQAPARRSVCYIGGDSSSSSDQTTNQIDRRVSGGAGGAQISGDRNTVTVNAIDSGAVYSGVELARAALIANQATLGQALQGLDSAYETGRAGDQRMLSMVGMAVVAVTALAVLPGLFKKG